MWGNKLPLTAGPPRSRYFEGLLKKEQSDINVSRCRWAPQTPQSPPHRTVLPEPSPQAGENRHDLELHAAGLAPRRAGSHPAGSAGGSGSSWSCSSGTEGWEHGPRQPRLDTEPSACKGKVRRETRLALGAFPGTRLGGSAPQHALPRSQTRQVPRSPHTWARGETHRVHMPSAKARGQAKHEGDSGRNGCC